MFVAVCVFVYEGGVCEERGECMRNHIANNTDSQNGSRMLETGYWLLHTGYKIVLMMEVGVLPLSGYPVTLIPVPVPSVPVIPVPVFVPVPVRVPVLVQGGAS